MSRLDSASGLRRQCGGLHVLVEQDVERRARFPVDAVVVGDGEAFEERLVRDPAQ
ncbi:MULTISPECIES: hypothetical protein [Brevibacterium]|uniref:hypothetical protein n=1 Tax=Brevibacterium TaxID=1696 RepID=UPI0020121F24|nr:hypothetical protein [Brevibacterium sp. W7.2]